MGTAEILNEGTVHERLAHPGSQLPETLTPTDETWERDRVVGGMVSNLGDHLPDIREVVEGFFPKSTN